MLRFKDPESFIGHWADRTIIDVRSPSEFHYGHIVGAINIPLFSDDERITVGTHYKQVNQQEAFLIGLDFAGQKLRWYVEQVLEKCKNGKISIYCWRGGQRSQSLAWLFDKAGLDVECLNGGYKAFRNYLQEYFNQWDSNIILIGGKTGSGKTAILHSLSTLGEQVLDLEKLACHKGSAFGGIGEGAQPSYEQFGNLIFYEISQMNPKNTIWIESESKAIGKVRIPDGIWNSICNAPMIELEIPLEERVRHLVDVYCKYSDQVLKESFLKITKRLGTLQVQSALNHIDKQEYKEAARIALHYYDKSYKHSLDFMKKGLHRSLKIEKYDALDIAKKMIGMLKERANGN